MSYDFKVLGQVNSVEEFPEGASVIIESEGVVKRCHADGLGGAMIVDASDLTFVESGDDRHFTYLQADDELYAKMKKAFPMLALKVGMPGMMSLSTETPADALMILPIKAYMENIEGLSGFQAELYETMIIIVDSSFIPTEPKPQ